MSSLSNKQPKSVHSILTIILRESLNFAGFTFLNDYTNLNYTLSSATD